MPSFCGLPCFKSKDQRHPEEQIVEKPVVVAVPTHSSATASNPVQTSIVKKESSSPEPIPSSYHTPTEPEPLSKTEPVSSDLKLPPPIETKQDTAKPEELPKTEPLTTTTETIQPQPTEPTELVITKPYNKDMDSLKGATSGVTDTVSSGAQQASSGVQSAASTAQNTASGGAEKTTTAASGGSSTDATDKWNAMTEDQKKQTYDALPAEKKDNLTYYEWIAQGYQHKKENWMPWIEDMYLRWFTTDNKASYATKDTLDKSKVTGIEQVDTLQDGVHGVVAGQVGQGGLLQPVGDMVSKEGVNRAERGGKDDSGSYAGAVGSSVSSAGGSVWSGAKSAGGYVGSMFGGGKKEEPSK